MKMIAEVTGLTIALNFPHQGLAIASIAQATGLTLEQLQQLQAENP
jgi:predicted transposase YdaD